MDQMRPSGISFDDSIGINSRLIRISDLSETNLANKLILNGLRSTTEFKSVEILGEGCSAKVFKVKDSKTNQFFAMKLMKKANLSIGTEDFREISIMKSLKHDNIAQLHQIAIAPGSSNISLILDYCVEPLSKLLERESTNLSLPQKKTIAKHLFQGVRHLHRNFVIHRDITSTNCVISPEGNLKIIDFGLARRVLPQNPKHKPMTPGLVTRWYRAPEILLEAPTYGFEADLWSAGCVLAEILQVNPLFPGNSDIQQINMIIEALGTPSQHTWPDFKFCDIPKKIRLAHQPLNQLHQRFKKYQGSVVLDLLGNLLVYDPSKRPSAEECCEHDWLQQAPFPDRSINIPKDSFDPE